MRERVRGEGLQTREVVSGQLQCLNGQRITARVPPYGKVAGFPVHSNARVHLRVRRWIRSELSRAIFLRDAAIRRSRFGLDGSEAMELMMV